MPAVFSTKDARTISLTPLQYSASVSEVEVDGVTTNWEEGPTDLKCEAIMLA